MPDIDIDFADRTKVLDIIKHVPASRLENGIIKKHNTGVYCHKIPVNPLTGLSNIEYEEAETRGYFKIDFLNVSIYKDVKNEEHLIELSTKEPLWELLENDDFTNLLFHINGYGDLLRKLKPKNIEQLAACLALIRPAKRALQNLTWNDIMDQIWEKPTNGDYHFKKAHAIAYALAVVVQMNLICEGVSPEIS
jgi:DNA polymerase III alpha subunit